MVVHVIFTAQICKGVAAGLSIPPRSAPIDR